MQQTKEKEEVQTDLGQQPRGLVLCNIGSGKGKTTASIGTAIRASGAGLNVCIIQFVKARETLDGEVKQPGEWSLSNEIKLLRNSTLDEKCGRIDCFQVGRGFVGILGDEKKMSDHVKAAHDGLILAHDMMHSGCYQLVVLDEIITAVELKLITEAAVARLIKNKPSMLHLFINGHKPFKKILDLCDTVTHMKVIKHAYYDGILAQKGIDF